MVIVVTHAADDRSRDGAGVVGRWILGDETRLGFGSWRLFRDSLLHEMRGYLVLIHGCDGVPTCWGCDKPLLERQDSTEYRSRLGSGRSVTLFGVPAGKLCDFMRPWTE